MEDPTDEAEPNALGQEAAEFRRENKALLAQLLEAQSQAAVFRHAMIHHISSAEAIAANIQWLWEKGRGNPERWHRALYDEDMFDDVGRLPVLLREAISTLEIEKLSLSLIEREALLIKPIDISELARNSIQQFSHRMPDQGHSIRFSTIGYPDHQAIGDERFLSIAISNLLDNAFKLSRRKSELQAVVRFRSKEYEFRLTSEVSDDLHKERQSIFQSFRRTQRQYPTRAGIGLPLSNRIILAHSEKGKMKIELNEKNPQKGYVFSTVGFTLPYHC